MSERRRRVGVVALLLCVAAVAGGLPAASAAAADVTATDVSPASVTTGTTTAVDVTLDVTDVNTSDETTDASVTVAVPDAVDLTSATASSPTVTPNATNVTATVDEAAGTVVLEWDDDAGVGAETLSVTVTVDGATVGRTGTHTVTADVDADADGTADVADATVGTISATADDSDRSVSGDSAKVFLGEETVDVTGLVGANPAGDPQQFYGVAGDAAETIASVDDTSSVDVTAANDFATGSYNLTTTGGDSALSVSSPSVTDVSLYVGEGTDGADVTDGSFSHTDVSTLTVEVSYNFDEAEPVELTVEDEDGLDVTTTLTSTTTVDASDGTLTLDVSDLDTGTYNVTAEGADDLDETTETATVTVRDEAKTISASKTRVTRGDSTIVTASGSPGETRYVRIDGDALATGETVSGATAERLYNATDQVAFVGANTDADYLYATIALDDDGFADVRVQTELLETETHDIELARSVTADDAEDSVSVSVVDREVTFTEAPDTVVVGEDVTLNGTAPEIDTVKLYAKVDTEYLPLSDDTGDAAEATVDEDGTWDVTVDTRDVLSQTDTYRIVAVGDPGSAVGSRTPLAADTFDEFDVTGSTTLRTAAGNLTGTVVPRTVAATGEDEVVVEGHAVGQGDTIRLYIVSPHGADQQVKALDIDVDDDRFSEDFDGVDQRGVHRVLVVGPGRDGTFAFADGGDARAIATELSGSETQAQAVEKIRDAYTGPGVDDVLVEGGLRASAPSLDVTNVTTDGDAVTVRGTSNREDDTSVGVELLDGSDTVTTGQATVNASTGQWQTTLDVSRVETGEYTLRAEDDESSTELAFAVGDEATPVATATPAETTISVTNATETATEATPTPAAEATEAATPEATTQTTATETPGFGPVVVAAALALSGLLARRRR